MSSLDEAYQDWVNDKCYECTGYGDDYRYDPDTDELICNCDDCPFREGEQDEQT